MGFAYKCESTETWLQISLCHLAIPFAHTHDLVRRSKSDTTHNNQASVTIASRTTIRYISKSIAFIMANAFNNTNEVLLAIRLVISRIDMEEPADLRALRTGQLPIGTRGQYGSTWEFAWSLFRNLAMGAWYPTPVLGEVLPEYHDVLRDVGNALWDSTYHTKEEIKVRIEFCDRLACKL